MHGPAENQHQNNQCNGYNKNPVATEDSHGVDDAHAKKIDSKLRKSYDRNSNHLSEFAHICAAINAAFNKVPSAHIDCSKDGNYTRKVEPCGNPTPASAT